MEKDRLLDRKSPFKESGLDINIPIRLWYIRKQRHKMEAEVHFEMSCQDYLY